MSNVQIIKLANLPEHAWINGAGATRELWRAVDGDSGSILLRISVATLTGPAGFSKLPGLSRTFMPLDDMAVVLSIDGQQRHLGQYEPVQFSGDADTNLVALDRPGLALNLMSDRRSASHAIALHCSGCFNCQAVIALEDWNSTFQLQAGDLILPSGTPVMLGGKAAVIEITYYG